MPRAKPSKKNSKRRSKTASRSQKTALDISWIRSLAAPYLRDYRAFRVASGSLRGYRFVPPLKALVDANVGFFVGYLVQPEAYKFLKPDPPEAIVFAHIGPVGSPVHQEIVAQEGSLLRKTAEYIGWLTHRPPRFAFFDNRAVVLVRHTSMTIWPEAKRTHFSRNFFIETLAWLVRSGLVAKLRGGTTSAASVGTV